MTEPRTLTRNASLTDIHTLLLGQHARKIDIIAPIGALQADGGRLVVKGEPQVTTDGVSPTACSSRPRCATAGSPTGSDTT